MALHNWYQSRTKCRSYFTRYKRINSWFFFLPATNYRSISKSQRRKLSTRFLMKEKVGFRLVENWIIKQTEDTCQNSNEFLNGFHEVTLVWWHSMRCSWYACSIGSCSEWCWKRLLFDNHEFERAQRNKKNKIQICFFLFAYIYIFFIYFPAHTKLNSKINTF